MNSHQRRVANRRSMPVEIFRTVPIYSDGHGGYIVGQVWRRRAPTIGAARAVVARFIPTDRAIAAEEASHG